MALHRLHLLSILSGLLLLSGSGATAAQSTVRCESTNGQYKACAVNTAGGVTLSRQLSSQGCWQNDTWGYDRNRIWVNRGCRADFRIGNSPASNSSDNTGAKVAGALVLGAIVAAVVAGNHDDRDDYRDNRDYRDNYYDNNYYDNRGYNGNARGQAREIRCESQGGRYATCGRIDRRDRVEIRRQLSNTQCVYGRSWGVDRRQLWVNDGCRAIFVTY